MGARQSTQAGPGRLEGHISTPNGQVSISEFKRLKALHRDDPSRYPDPKDSLGLRGTSYISVNGDIQPGLRNPRDQVQAEFIRPENLHAEENALPAGTSWSSSWHYGLSGQSSRFDVHEASQRSPGE